MIDRRPRESGHGSHLLLATALLLAVSGCAGPYPPPPDTREEAVVDVLHGVEFTDDYRWLEDQEGVHLHPPFP